MGDSLRRRGRERDWPATLFGPLGLLIAVALFAFGAGLLPPGDVELYGHYAYLALHGPLSRGLPVEYPALAGAWFVTVALVPFPYVPTFVVSMSVVFGAFLLGGTRMLRRIGTTDSGWAVRTVLYLLAATAPVLLARYDLLSAACVFLAVIWGGQGRYGRAWAAAALGTALQLFPAVLLPGFFLYEWRRTGKLPWKRCLVTLGAAASLGALQALIAPGTLLSPFTYEIKRGFEFSSVPGSISLLIDPSHLRWIFAYGTVEVVGVGSSAIRVGLLCIEIIAMAGIWVLAANGRLGVEATSLAVISVAVLTDRALAPQYLIWLAPLWALWPIRRAWVGAAVLTVVTFPLAPMVDSLYHVSPIGATVAGLIRNCVLIVGTATWFIQQVRTGGLVPQMPYRHGHQTPISSADIIESRYTSVGPLHISSRRIA